MCLALSLLFPPRFLRMPQAEQSPLVWAVLSASSSLFQTYDPYLLSTWFIGYHDVVVVMMEGVRSGEDKRDCGLDHTGGVDDVMRDVPTAMILGAGPDRFGSGGDDATHLLARR
jgi:hypothetical protein